MSVLVSALLCAPMSTSARSSSDPLADKPCGAIELLNAFERVAAIEDVEEAGTDLKSVDAWYARCRRSLLEPDREWVDIRASTARESLTWPRTLERAVDDIIEGLSVEDRDSIRSQSRDDLILYHHGWGTGIRNETGLWRGNHALLRAACDGEPCHPDDASMKIIEAVWERLQKIPPSSAN